MILVITSLHVRNFKGFNNISLPAIKPVTLLSGTNNVGKSTLLESIFLVNDHFAPEVFLKLNAFRGMANQPISSFSSLFTAGDISKTIEVDLGLDDECYSLSLNVDDTHSFASTEIPNEVRQILTSQPVSHSTASTLAYRFVNSTHSYEERGYFLIRPNGLFKNIENAPQTIINMPFTQYISSNTRSEAAQVAEWFGRLEMLDQKQLIITALQNIDSSINDIATIVTNGFAQLYAKVNGKLLPLKLLGDGTNRMILMLLAVLANPNGIILIDEVENGFHHSVLSSLWYNLLYAAKLVNCQIIATTHSYECIQSAINQASVLSCTENFGFMRLEKHDNQLSVKSFSQSALSYALKSELEVR